MFNKKFGPGSILKNVLLENKPSITEKIKMLVQDAEIEGKKQGYEKASNEYKKVFRSIELEYKEAKELIDTQKNSYDSESDLLIRKLSALENEKKKLERQVEQKTKDLSSKYGIPIGDINTSLASGLLITTGIPTLGIFDLIYSYKERKLRKAEQFGYSEAKKMYDEKIHRLKKNLYELKKKGSVEMQKLLGLISELFNAIAEEQMKIADLKILLKR